MVPHMVQVSCGRRRVAAVLLASFAIEQVSGLAWLAKTSPTPRPASSLTPRALEELIGLKQQFGGQLAQLRAYQGWCLDDSQLSDLQCSKETLVRPTCHLDPADQAHLMLAVELLYQARTAVGQIDKVRHVLAVARVLGSIGADLHVIEAALLAGICDDTGVTEGDLENVLGVNASSAVLHVGMGVEKVWRLSELLERASQPTEGVSLRKLKSDGVSLPDAESDSVSLPDSLPDRPSAVKAEQLERQCQILLAGCDDACSIVISLASRLVSMRELQAALAGRPLSESDLSSAPRLSHCALGCVQPVLWTAQQRARPSSWQEVTCQRGAH